MARVRIGEETRRPSAARPEIFLSAFDVRRAPSSASRSACGALARSVSRALRFTVDAGGRGSRRRPFERTLEGQAATQWAARAHPPRPLAGSTVEIGFGVTQVEPGSARPFWGEVRHLAARHLAAEERPAHLSGHAPGGPAGCYGYARATSPRIDGLAADGVRFHQAISQAPWTTPSDASLLTSRYPSSHRMTQSFSRFDRFGRRAGALVSSRRKAPPWPRSSRRAATGRWP